MCRKTELVLVIQIQFRGILKLLHVSTQETSCEIGTHRGDKEVLGFSWSSAENSSFVGFLMFRKTSWIQCGV